MTVKEVALDYRKLLVKSIRSVTCSMVCAFLASVDLPAGLAVQDGGIGE